MSHNFKDRTGQTFGRLTVIERAADTVSTSGRRRTAWLCRCECGNETVVSAANLSSGHTTSCGCASRDAVVARNKAGRRNDAGYIAAHMRIRRERGAAKHLACADCSAPAAEWSYDHTDPDELMGAMPWGGKIREVAYSLKPEHYSPRCKSCHIIFDRNREVAHV